MSELTAWQSDISMNRYRCTAKQAHVRLHLKLNAHIVKLSWTIQKSDCLFSKKKANRFVAFYGYLKTLWTSRSSIVHFTYSPTYSQVSVQTVIVNCCCMMAVCRREVDSMTRAAALFRSCLGFKLVCLFTYSSPLQLVSASSSQIC